MEIVAFTEKKNVEKEQRSTGRGRLVSEHYQEQGPDWDGPSLWASMAVLMHKKPPLLISNYLYQMVPPKNKLKKMYRDTDRYWRKVSYPGEGLIILPSSRKVPGKIERGRKKKTEWKRRQLIKRRRAQANCMAVPPQSPFLGGRASCFFLMLVVLNLLKEWCWDDTKVLIAFEIQVLSGEGRKLANDTKVKQNIFYFDSVND